MAWCTLASSEWPRARIHMSVLQQCGLCLSCGVPFMPSSDDTDLYRHTGNLSILFLNVEFKNNHQIRLQYLTPKFTSDKQESHVFHGSHHGTALNHMCNHHRDDSNLVWPAAPLLPGAGGSVIPDDPVAGNGPIPYYRSPGSKKGRKPHGAVWDAPPLADRLDFSPLLDHMILAAQKPTARGSAQNLGEKFSICRGCNAIMTQRNDMEYHLGLGGMRAENNDPIIKTSNPPPISQSVTDDHGKDPESGYGVWSRSRGGPGARSPKGRNEDDLAPAVAYYLHLCLPFIDPATANPFDRIVGSEQVEMRRSARTLYLELSWLILEIACVATLKEQGRLYKPVGERSHGPHQHAGVLDFYVSYFIFRMLDFEFGQDVHREGLDFVQWHQKYYTDAINCKELFRNVTGVARDTLLASQVYSNTNKSSRELVQDICAGLMRLYTETLEPLVQFTRGRHEQLALPAGVRQYFLPLPAMRELRRRSSTRVSRAHPPTHCRHVFFSREEGSRSHRAIFFLFRGVFLFLFSGFRLAGHTARLRVIAAGVRCGRPVVPHRPAVQGLSLRVQGTAQRFQAVLAVGRDRAHPAEQSQADVALGPHHLSHVLALGSARDHPRG